jgi:hypothetical protein
MYKPDIADQRESPSRPLARKLITAGAEVAYHDPHVSAWSVGTQQVERVWTPTEQSARCPKHHPKVMNFRTCFAYSGPVPCKLVEVLKDYSDTFPLVKALRFDLANHAKPDTESRVGSMISKTPVRAASRPLRKRLAPKDRQRLIADYLAGTFQKDLAAQYSIGLSSVKTVLREAGARKYTART